MKKNIQTRHTSDTTIIMSILLFATMSRIAIPPFIGHPPNFSAIDATALFCGAYFARSSIAYCVVLLSVWIGDIFLSKIFTGDWILFYSGFYWQYASYVIITLIGVSLKNKTKSIYLLLACLASSILFFGISNFGVWYSGILYPMTLDGLMACYVAAIPFFKNTLMSDLFFTGVLFGSFELYKLIAGQSGSKLNNFNPL